MTSSHKHTKETTTYKTTNSKNNLNTWRTDFLHLTTKNTTLRRVKEQNYDWSGAKPFPLLTYKWERVRNREGEETKPQESCMCSGKMSTYSIELRKNSGIKHEGELEGCGRPNLCGGPACCVNHSKTQHRHRSLKRDLPLGSVPKVWGSEGTLSVGKKG